MSEAFVRLQGSVPFTPHPRVGSIDPHERIEFTIKLRRATHAGLPTLDEFIAGKRAEGIDRRALLETYASSRDDADAVARWAREHNLSVLLSDPAHRRVRLVGSAADIERAFAITITLHRDPNTGKTFHSYDAELGIPVELKDVIVGVFGLDTRKVTVRHSVSITKSTLAATNPKAQFPGCFFPNEVAELYNFPTTTGAGQKVAILEFGGGFDPVELSSYFTNFIGLPQVPVANPISVLGAKMDVGDGATGEVYLDIEVVGGMAPGASMDVYFAPWTAEGYLAAISAAIKNDDYAAISISYGLSEDLASTSDQPGWAMLNKAVDEAFSEAAAIGVPIFVSTGDQGSGSGRGAVIVQNQQVEVTYQTPELHACYPATSPYATAVGGTQLYAENNAITDEVVWNELGAAFTATYYDESGANKHGKIYVGGATGGGVSRHYTTSPSYQTKAGVNLQSGNQPPASGRCIPDVAGNAGASTGYIVSQPPGSSIALAPVGGTSAAAPMWAALMACAREALQTEFAGAIPTYFLNDFIYENGATSAFRDIVKGRLFSYPPNTGGVPGDFIATGNNCSSTKNSYNAGNGYDLCTGWGSPNGKELVQRLTGWLRAKAQLGADAQESVSTKA
jgi:kumamolisin